MNVGFATRPRRPNVVFEIYLGPAGAFHQLFVFCHTPDLDRNIYAVHCMKGEGMIRVEAQDD